MPLSLYRLINTLITDKNMVMLVVHTTSWRTSNRHDTFLWEKCVWTYLRKACAVTHSDNKRAHAFIAPDVVKNWADDYEDYDDFCSLELRSCLPCLPWSVLIVILTSSCNPLSIYHSISISLASRSSLIKYSPDEWPFTLQKVMEIFVE